MKVTVIGAAGRMGGWLTQHFVKQGDTVVLYDLDVEAARRLAGKLGQKAAKDLGAAVRGSDAVFVSVPLDATPQVLSKLSRYLDGARVVVEIASLKIQSAEALRKLEGKCGVLLALHPLFGPGVRSLKGKRVVLTPIVDRRREVETARKLFPGAILVESSVEEHDRLMALALNLTHFVNTVFAKVVSEADLRRLRELGGTSFTLQVMLAESILHDDPGLLASIQVRNRFGEEYVGRYLQEASRLASLVKGNVDDVQRYFLDLRKKVSKDPGFEKSYEKTYAFLESVTRS